MRMFSKLLIMKTIALVLVYSLVKLAELSEACGPGRAGGHRRQLRKYPPLVQRQYIPNVSENTLGASGLPEGAIKRRDKRFRELVQNWNPDIEFKDQERTGADRMMSQRLKEKLSILAISVMNQWPNVKLRVIEGWDEDGKHAENSLHYEGRAVDITTSDKDRTKYGMLARLAVEAGFDWVHYEARTHVHCSVKSERADIIRNNGCFHAAGLVDTPEGQVQMSELQLNDQVLTMNSRTGKLQFSPIIMWLDRDELGEELYVELRTKSNRQLYLTSSHLLYVSDEPIDLTQQIHEPEMMQPKTGNSIANHDNNYYYYETREETFNREGERNDQIASLQITNNSVNTNNITNNHTLLSDNNSTEKPDALEINEAAYTIYARNAYVGQYLLITPAESWSQQTFNQQDSTNTLHNNFASTRRSRLVFTRESAESEDDVQKTPIGVERDERVKSDQIVSINYVTRKGIYAPLTREGNIVVNSVVASCYAVISDHDMAHLSFAPVRWFSYFNQWLFGQPRPSFLLRERILRARHSSDTQRNSLKDTQIATNYTETPHRKQETSRVIHWYPLILYNIARYVLPSGLLY